MEFGGAGVDESLLDGADGDEGMEVAGDEFAGEVDEGGGFEVADESRDAVVFDEIAGGEVGVGVVVGDLVDGLGAHLVAAGGVGFGGGEVLLAEAAGEELLEFLVDEIEKISGRLGVDFAIEVPRGVVPAVAEIAAHTIDEAATSSLTKDAAVHGAV